MQRRTFNVQFLVVTVLVLYVTSFTLAKDAKQVFDELFAVKMKQATSTRDKADDIAVAKEMISLARTAVDQPAFAALLCENAYDLGMRDREGYALAVEAMALLAKESPAHREAADAKRLEALNRAYVTAGAEERQAAGETLIDALLAIAEAQAEKEQFKGAVAEYRKAMVVAARINSSQTDSIRAKMDHAASRDRVDQQIAQYRAKLLENANDHATAEALVKLYIIELDRPAAATAFLDFVKDEQLKTNVALAAGPIEKLDEKTCEMLGDWYRALGAATRDRTRTQLHRRAAAYYKRYLELHPANDLARTRNAARLEEVQQVVIDPSAGPTAKSSKLPKPLVLFTFDRDSFASDPKPVIKDSSGAERHAENHGVEIAKDGLVGEAGQFDGTGASATIPSLYDLITKDMGTLSISLWAKPAEAGGDRMLFDVGFFTAGAFTVASIEKRWTFVVASKAPEILTGSAAESGKWHHVVAVFDRGQMTMYVNGAAVAKNQRPAFTLNPGVIRKDIDGTGHVARIGGQAKAKLRGERYFKGLIDEMAMYDAALSKEQVKMLFDAGKAGRGLVKLH